MSEEISWQSRWKEKSDGKAKKKRRKGMERIYAFNASRYMLVFNSAPPTFSSPAFHSLGVRSKQCAGGVWNENMGGHKKKVRQGCSLPLLPLFFLKRPGTTDPSFYATQQQQQQRTTTSTVNNNNSSMTDYPGYIYSLLVFTGGVIGYVKGRIACLIFVLEHGIMKKWSTSHCLL